MPTRYVSEKSALAPKKNANGTYPIVIIDEGTGSSGVYSRALLEKSAHIFEGSASYLNHVPDPNKPHERDVRTLAGRVSNVRAEERNGKMALVGEYTPRTDEVRDMVENFSDLIGASIFCAADGELDDSGRVVVEEFVDADPYKAVDIVSAAGRGGRFERAAEAMRTAETSLGLPADTPKKKVENVEIKELSEQINALAESLKPVFAFVTEESARRQAEAERAAEKQDIGEAVDAAVAAVEAVKAANLYPRLEKKLIEAARKGEFDAAEFEDAKATVAEGRAENPTAPKSYVHEASSDTATWDYTVSRMKGN